MPTVNFSLDDIRRLLKEVISEDVPPIVEKIVEERVPQIIDERVPQIFNDFCESNLSPVFEDIDCQFDEIRGSLDEIKTEVRGTRRLVRKHSSDIAELQAHQGL
jgi:archaellum component FlaC